ncbi:GPI inositol-deacylase isoform X2 [Diprion similis]|uniref:GPI inositol-deacylase isoform X2 n=1 Tax=Diprion similis TaxID=362088 RepID=UPI001EF94D9C|nr:GPI inositol-deacylase isoform X2 [Diprion similis]
MKSYFMCIVISTPVLIMYLLGTVKFIFDHEGNSCEMTYMFEYPEYVHIPLQKEIQQQYPRYGLYVYGEGFTVSRLRAMHFSGIPVLFIPGNAGSHHQGVLKEQIEFVSHCIRKILKFYGGKIDSVIIIGHSMGGIVGKGVLLDPNMISQVNTIIMLATPHEAALVFDTSIATIYQKLQSSGAPTNKSEMLTISVGGGPRDVLVNSNQIIDRTADLNVLTTHVPGVWKSTDHVSILWCKEFLLAIIRALFDCVDMVARYPRISSNKQHRLEVFNYHLLQRCCGKKMDQYQAKVQFRLGGEWVEDIRRQYTWKAADRIGSKNISQLYLMIRLIGIEDHLTIQTTRLEVKDWLFICSASAIQGHSRVCEWGWNLTNKSRIIPDGTYKKKTADLDLVELKTQRLTHIVIRIPSSIFHKGLSIDVDLHRKSDRILKFQNQPMAAYWGFGKLGTIESNIGDVRYEVDLASDTDSVLLKVINVQCEQQNHRHHATIELLEPCSNGISQVRHFAYENLMPKTLKVQTKNAVDGGKGVGNVPLKLKFTLDPKCRYTIEVFSGGYIETLSTAVRDRWPNLYGVMAGLLLLALATQLDHEAGLFKSTITTVVTLALCVGIGIGPEGFVSLALLQIFAVVICCAVVIFGSTVYNMAQRFLTRALKFSPMWSEWLIGALNQLPLIAPTILLSMVPVTCGALSMFIFVGLQFLKLTRIYEDYLEELLLASLRSNFINRFRDKTKKPSSGEQIQGDTHTDGKQIVFQLILFLTWCIAAIPAIPSVLTWAKNYRFSVKLSTEDPLLKTCWIILVGCGSTGIKWIPPSTPDYYSQAIAIIIRILGWTALAVTGIGYPSQYQYLMPPLITVAVALITIRSLINISS